MSMPFEFETDYVQGAKIKVIGIGGAGSNAVDELIKSNLQGVEFYVMNTDVQALGLSKAPNKIQIGRELTRGRGAGSNPDIGRQAAEEAADEIQRILAGADIVFITAGLGGGTGTGAAPVVARIARDLGILTVAVVTLPFEFEGRQRAKNAQMGLSQLREIVDACTVVNNSRLLSLADNKTGFEEGLRMANEILTMAVTSVSEIINVPGKINVEFSDVRTIMQGKGGAVIGIGVGKGDRRAVEAVEKARENKLLDGLDISGATGILICFTGGPDLTLQEVNDACNIIHKEADPDANIIFGLVIDEKMKDEVRVTIIATGLDRGLPDDRIVSHLGPRVEPARPEVPATPSVSRISSPAPSYSFVEPPEKAAPFAGPKSPSPAEKTDFRLEAGVGEKNAPAPESSAAFPRPSEPVQPAAAKPGAEQGAPAEPPSPPPDSKEAPAYYRRRWGL
ncbi:MAG: cell division protein FtsZ [Candidatus Sumerlaeaceae bacterium]|jgi:cell division protein FtsZ